MPAAVSDGAQLEEVPGGGWWWRRWVSDDILAGVADRQMSPEVLISRLGRSVAVVRAEQVHGGSLAGIGTTSGVMEPVPGCDALLTQVPNLALLARTADCLPLFFADGSRGVVGLAHAGWRGMAAQLPARMVAAFRRLYHSQTDALTVAIGPAIRACCYEVGPEFDARFGSHIQRRAGRRLCDLIGMAKAQLQQCGVAPGRIVDSEYCTACEPQRWFSLRREGPQTGRLTSVIMLRRN